MEDMEEKFALEVEDASVLGGGIWQACCSHHDASWKMTKKSYGV
jgi:hypothetical protein